MYPFSIELEIYKDSEKKNKRKKKFQETDVRCIFEKKNQRMSRAFV